MNWFIYIVRCADKSLYTGKTNNLKRRMRQHNGELAGGAKYTRARRPVQLVYFEECEDLSHALQQEFALKQLTRREKEKMIEKDSRI